MAGIKWVSSVLVLLLVVCAQVRTYDNAFMSDDKNRPNVRTFNVPQDILYTATSRAILGDNFRIEKDDGKHLIAGKYYQDGDKTVTLAISLTVQDAGNGKSTCYASAVQSISKVRVKNEYFHLLFLPTPIKTSSQATQTKEEERTIDDEAFYARLFKAVDKELSRVSETQHSLIHDEIKVTDTLPAK